MKAKVSHQLLHPIHKSRYESTSNKTKTKQRSNRKETKEFQFEER